MRDITCSLRFAICSLFAQWACAKLLLAEYPYLISHVHIPIPVSCLKKIPPSGGFLFLDFCHRLSTVCWPGIQFCNQCLILSAVSCHSINWRSYTCSGSVRRASTLPRFRFTRRLFKIVHCTTGQRIRVLFHVGAPESVQKSHGWPTE